MNKKKKVLWLLAWMSMHTAAQVGIGDALPDDAAMLDVRSGNKGVLIPRISLSSTTHDLDGVRGQANGLLIYNTGTSLPPGFYFWDGAEWEKLDASPPIVPHISGLACEQAVLEPQSFTAGTAYNGIMKIPYSGGNGAKYPAGTWSASTNGNTGMQARLKAGQLEHGAGYLTYDVTGTPQQSSPIGATFSIAFGTYRCQATVGEIQKATNKSISSAGPLLPTTDNQTRGYHRVVTTPDGKFSIRVFVTEGEELQNADIQIRSNHGRAVLSWNAHISWQGGNKGTASNLFTLPRGDMWYGNADINSDAPEAITQNTRVGWSDRDVYYAAPEQRKYIWTADSSPTVYTLTFSMGAPSPELQATSANIAQTKAFLRIEQLEAN
jgi:hypothetical protein